ncbi:MAG: MATE family efflux transporter [Elusimicrobiota bacterium]|jgi:putative MATE family efflux protein
MKDLTEGDEAKLIWNFTVPMLIGNVFQQSYNVIDSVIVGRFVGKAALAAVGASFPVLFLLVALTIGVTMGFSILIAQYYGAKDMVRVRRAIDTSYVFLFFASLAITAVGLAVTEPVLRLLRTPADVLAPAVLFLRITFAGMIFLFGYSSVSAILRGLGDSKTPLYFLIFSSILNAILALVFVAVFGWGVAGSAWASVLAQAAAFLLCVAYLNRTHAVLRFRLRGLIFDREIFRKSLLIGIPTGFQQVAVATGMMALTRIVNGFGTDAIAAFTAAGRLDAFASMPAMNLSAAVSTFVGQNLGAGKPERVRQGLFAALRIAAVISLTTTLIVVLFAPRLIALFNADPGVVAIGVRYLHIVGCFYVVFAGMFVVNGVLRGAGDTFIPMIITVLALWLIRVPLSEFLSRRMGTDGIWWGVPVAWGAGLLLSSLYCATGRWKRKVVARPVVVSAPEADEAEWNTANF